MTTKQRMSILLVRWPAACQAQGWDPKNRERRLQVISDAVNREITSMNDLDNSADIDKVYAHLGRLADHVARTIETLPAETVTVSARDTRVNQQDTAGYRRRILWLIRKQGHPLGGLPYILGLARDKFHLTAGLATIEDLSTAQLHQLMMTLSARKSRRNQAAKANASLTSEETFPDQVEFAPDPETANCPF